MKKKMKRLFSALTACAISAAALAALPVQAVTDINIPAVLGEDRVGLAGGDEYFIDHIKEPKRGAYYDIWKEDDAGDISLDLNKGNLSFDCTWNNTKRAEFLVGRASNIDLGDYKTYYLRYSADIECKDGYGFGAAFSCEDKEAQLPAEVRILEAYSGDSYLNYEFLKEIKVNDAVYNVYRTTKVYNDISVRIIYVMRQSELIGEAHMKGNIDIKGIFGELSSIEGLSLTELKTPQLYVEGSGKKGSVSVTQNEAVYSAVPSDITVPNYNKNNEYVFFDGMRYSFLQNDEKSDGKMVFKKNGSAVCTYNNTNDDSDCLFKKGVHESGSLTPDKYEKLKVDYSINIKADKSYGAGVYGWLTDPLTEFYVVQFRKGDSFIGDAKPVDTAEIDGVKYDIYKREINLSSVSSKKIVQFWSVSQVVFNDPQYEGNGSVDLSKHIEVWEKAGLKTGGIYEVSAFAESFGKGSGEFVIGDVNADIVSLAAKDDIVLEGKNGNTCHCEKDGYRYDAGQSYGSCTVKSDGSVAGKCFQEYEGDKYYFDKGIEFDADKAISADGEASLKVSYDADVSVDGAYYISADGVMYGKNNEPYIYYHIYESANMIKEPINSEYLGKFRIGDKNYKLYVVHSRTSYKTGGRCIDEYFSVCTDTTGNYTGVKSEVDVLEHVRAWKKAGLDTGALKSAYINVDILGMGNGEVVLNSGEVSTGESKAESFTMTDVEMFSNFLLGQECDLSGKDFDINGDGVWDTFDLIALRRLAAEE